MVWILQKPYDRNKTCQKGLLYLFRFATLREKKMEVATSGHL